MAGYTPPDLGGHPSRNQTKALAYTHSGEATTEESLHLDTEVYVIQQGVIGGTTLDPANEPNFWSVWQQLQGAIYNISIVGYVHIWGAGQVNVPRPGLTTSEDHTRQTLSAIRNVVKGACHGQCRQVSVARPGFRHVVLGGVGIFPLIYITYFLTQYPLAALGLTEREPTENDGILISLVALVGVSPFFVIWAVINEVIRRITRLPHRSYWWASAIVSLLPFVFFMNFPDAFTALL
ncbi:hypothetical protein GT755_05990 [Herbidospora sp. NEAU-GS84]|uniref:Uncharacterized protein n=1 Tax=Herbidospora solisilvae TaxID=2696284 RepID=A0A7C9NL93_9ACTN|nr:hypothetical protein [Herbidospora solisilvae]NAS21236.1 hypothetical protein [Herbidospora solisilvae]